ncbi:ATPase [bacterium]|nr:ATPase [bacterium]
MEQKTKVHAEEGKQELSISRVFEIPVHLLFRAYTEADLIEQFMGNTVLKLENKAHGSYLFEKKDELGNVLFRANGCIHSIIPNQQIIRTFEMENTSFPPQLEFLSFEEIAADKSELKVKIVFKSETDRDNQLKLPFEYGLNMAHDQLQHVINKLSE